MKLRPIPEDLALVARRMVCHEPQKQALACPEVFLSCVMTYGTARDIVTAEKYFTAEEFRQALENAPPGVFDGRSWAYWNTVFGRVPVPPLPRRKLSGAKQTGET
jgi:hypothetical protein